MNEPAAATAASTQRKSKVLMPAQVDAFRRNGYHFPVRALRSMKRSPTGKGWISEATLGGPMRGALRSKPHLLFTWANELIRHPTILDAVEDIYGPNLLVWSSASP